MSGEDEETLEMLEDIASLLLILHETYIGGLEDVNVLAGLLSFLHDSNLLSNEYLSLVEVERIRQKVRGDSEESGNGMSPQEFFAWLKEAACLLYEDTDGKGKTALHNLFTEHIFPCSVSNSGLRNQRLEIFQLLDKPSLTCLIEFEDLLRFWYCNMTIQVGCNRHIKLWNIWKQIVDAKAKISGNQILENFCRLQITDRFIKSSELSRLLQNIVVDVDVSDKYSFSDFVIIVSSVIISYHKGRGYEKGDIHQSCSYFFENLAQKLVYFIFEKFSSQCLQDHIMPSVSIGSMLWLLRQSKIFQTLSQLESLRKEVDIRPSCSHSEFISVLFSATSFTSEFILKSAKHRLISAGISFEPDSEPFLLIAAVYPELLFADRNPQFFYLEVFYEKFFSIDLTPLKCLWRYLNEYIYSHPELSSSIGSSESLSFHSIVHILQLPSPLNDSLSMDKTIKLASSIFTEATLLEIDFLGLFEFLFALSWKYFKVRTCLFESITDDSRSSNFTKFIEILTDLVKPPSNYLSNSSENTVSFVPFDTISNSGLRKNVDESEFEIGLTPCVGNSLKFLDLLSTAEAIFLVAGECQLKTVSFLAYMYMYFPMNCEDFVSWNLLDNNEYTRELNLLEIISFLKFISKEFCLPDSDICMFANNLLISSNGCIDRQICSRFFSDDFVTLMLQPQVQSMLKATKHLILAEYFRCYLKSKVGVEFMNRTVLLYPTLDVFSAFPEIIMPSMKAAISWAIETLGISKKNAVRCIKLTLSPTGRPIIDKLTFSMFILFILRCLAYQHSCEKGLSKNLSQYILINLPHLLSQSVLLIEKEIKVKINTLFLSDSSSSSSVFTLNKQDSCAVLSSSIAEFCSRFSVKLSDIAFAEKIDAPKFLEICKFLGILSISESFACCWFAFGKYLKSMGIVTSCKVVPDCMTDLSSRSLFDLISFVTIVCNEIRMKSGISNILELDWVLSHVVCASTISWIDARIGGPCSDLASLSYSNEYEDGILSLQDLLRIGGHIVMKSISSLSPCMFELYESIKLDRDEAPVSDILSVLVKITGVSQEILYKMAQVSAHPRIRPTVHSEHYDSFQYIEFQELLLRCSYLMWMKTDSLHKIPDMNTHFVRRYLHYRADLSKSLDSASWGIDFVTPFILALTRLNNSSLASISTAEILLTPKETTSSSMPRKSVVSIDIKDSTPQFLATLTEEIDIISRRDEILSSILASRNNSSVSVSLKSISSSDDLEMSSRSSTPVFTRSHSRLRPESPSVETCTNFVLAIDALLDGTKESLWPVFVTYCSCGDSLNPGKISGPNLFTLLSKLNILCDRIALSDIGILFHHISVHSLHVAPVSRLAVDNADVDNVSHSPSLSFEEFLVFLCAFSHLYYEGSVKLPSLENRKTGALSESDSQSWFQSWLIVMKESKTFHILLEKQILPRLRGQILLAVPEDARKRDSYDALFSLKFLFDIEKFEKLLYKIFKKLISGHCFSLEIDNASENRHLFPCDGLDISLLCQHMRDVLQLKRDKPTQITFPQWEWVLTVSIFELSHSSISQQIRSEELHESTPADSVLSNLNSLLKTTIQSISRSHSILST